MSDNESLDLSRVPAPSARCIGCCLCDWDLRMACLQEYTCICQGHCDGNGIMEPYKPPVHSCCNCKGLSYECAQMQTCVCQETCDGQGNLSS
jgi:hypothetical protein